MFALLFGVISLLYATVGQAGRDGFSRVVGNPPREAVAAG